jgi:hypothetical protein
MKVSDNFLLVVAAALLIVATDGVAQDTTSKNSDEGKFVVSYTTELQPLAINKIHNWVIHVESTNGTLIDDATITLVGGMPVHDHGLPTLPLATQNLGDGDFLVEGMKFHMNGWWQVTVSIVSGDDTDSVTFELQL